MCTPKNYQKNKNKNIDKHCKNLKINNKYTVSIKYQPIKTNRGSRNILFFL